MARINKNKLISGAIGNVVFRDVRKKQIIQQKRKDIRQTTDTIISGSEFRKCSSWAKWLRLGLTSFLGKHTDHYMYSRLAGQVYKAIQLNTALPKGMRTPINSTMDLLTGFEFNTYSPFTNYFTPEIAAVLNDQNQVVVTVPAFNPKTAMRFAKGTDKAELLLYVLGTTFDDNALYHDAFTKIPIEKKEETTAETVWTSSALPQGDLILVCAKLLFYTTNRFAEKQYSNSKECSPATIVMVK